VLSWYQGVSLDQLEHLREGGLVGLDKAKLRQCACSIVECANTNEFFDAGEGDGDESLDDVDFEEPSFAEAPKKASEDPAYSSIPPSPSGDNFILVARTGDAAPLEPADSPIAPNRIGVSLLVCICTEFIPCLRTLYSCTSTLFYPKLFLP
jgi:hypothetical protein